MTEKYKNMSVTEYRNLTEGFGSTLERKEKDRFSYFYSSVLLKFYNTEK